MYDKLKQVNSWLCLTGFSEILIGVIHVILYGSYSIGQTANPYALAAITEVGIGEVVFILTVVLAWVLMDAPDDGW